MLTIHSSRYSIDSHRIVRSPANDYLSVHRSLIVLSYPFPKRKTHLRQVAILFYFFAHCFHLLAGDSLDSLQISIDQYQQQNDRPALAITYQKLISHYLQQGNGELALKKGEEALRYAESWADTLLQFHFLNSLGEVHYQAFDDSEKALELLLKAYRYGKGKVALSALQENYTLIAKVYASRGKLSQALEYQLQMIGLAEKQQDSMAMVQSYQNLGDLCSSIHDTEHALDSYLRALHYYPALSPVTKLKQELFSRVGRSFLELHQVTEARPYLILAADLADSLRYQPGRSKAQGNWGIYYALKRDFDRAKVYLEKATLLAREQGLKHSQADFAIAWARILNEQKLYVEALRKLDQAEEAFPPGHDLVLEMSLLQVRAQSYEGLGRKDLAYDHLANYQALRDTFLNNNQLVDFGRTESEFREKKKDVQILNLQEKQAFTEKWIFIIAGLAGLVVLAVLFLVGYNRNRSLNRVNRILAQKNEEINLQNERLANSNEELRQFAHITSHDLREPLRSIGGFATLLKRRYADQLDQQANEYIQFITRGVSRMDKLLSDLMVYSVIGILDQKFVTVSIEKVITGILENLQKSNLDQGAKISIQNLPTLVADAKQMKMLFEHLIDNALKFRRGDIPEVNINCVQDGDHYLFSISDNGIGMDEAYKDQIFGLFLRLHNNSSEYEGTGIGLSICRKIVQQHKGKIWIESQKGLGTTVYFLLPESPLKSNQPLSAREKA
jgi:signal transduction histidine kinase